MGAKHLSHIGVKNMHECNFVCSMGKMNRSAAEAVTTMSPALSHIEADDFCTGFSNLPSRGMHERG